MKKLGAILLACVFGFLLVGCGSNSGGLDSLPEYDEEHTFLVGGWDAPPLNDNSFRVASEMGLNFMYYGYDQYNNIKNYLEKYDLQVMLHARERMDWIENFNNKNAFLSDPNVLAINYWDEPSFSELDTLKEFALYHRENITPEYKVDFFANLYPSYADVSVIEGPYEDYVEKYMEIMSSSQGETWASVDIYPLKLDPLTGSSVSVDWLTNLETVANAAKEYGIDQFHVYIQTTRHYNYREVTEEDLRYQMWVSMAYGATSATYFTYAESPLEDFGTALVDENGNPNPLYYGAQKVTQEIHAFDDVYLSFDWEGVYAVTGTENTDVNSSGVSNHMKGLKTPLAALNGIKSVSSSLDALIGQFSDKDGNNGFVVTNFADPYFGEESKNTVTLNFEKANRAIICRRGEVKTYQVKDNRLDIELDEGEGVFVIPVLLNK